MKLFKKFRERRSITKHITKVNAIARIPFNKLIINTLIEHKGLSFGDLIKLLNTSPVKGIKHILDLKRWGIIKEDIVSTNYYLNSNNLLRTIWFEAN